MLQAIIFIVIGVFLGWQIPQPSWAKSIQNKVVSWIKGISK